MYSVKENKIIKSKLSKLKFLLVITGILHEYENLYIIKYLNQLNFDLFCHTSGVFLLRRNSGSYFSN